MRHLINIKPRARASPSLAPLNHYRFDMLQSLTDQPLSTAHAHANDRIQHLEDVLVLQLQELIETERVVVQQLPSLIAQLQNEELRMTLQSHSEGIPVRLEELRLLQNQRKAEIPLDGISPIAALLNRTQQQLVSTERNRGVLDTLLLNAALKMQHYKMAAYEEARDYAELLNDEYACDTLRTLFQEEETIAFVLKEIASEVVNERSIVA